MKRVLFAARAVAFLLSPSLSKRLFLLAEPARALAAHLFGGFMVETEASSLKLGRVSKNVERALSTTLTGDVFVYIKEENLNAFAVKYPNDYLRRMALVKDIITHPHYAAYIKEEEKIYLFRTYYKDGVFKTFALVLKKGDCWEFLALEKASYSRPYSSSLSVNEVKTSRPS